MRIGARSLCLEFVLLGAVFASPARAEDLDLATSEVPPADEPEILPAEEPKIRDNLFLLEEAYNQEPGVVQHIQALVLTPHTHEFSYSFTDEWPAPTDLLQLSFTVPLSRAEDEVQMGDIALNARVQAIGLGGAGRVALAPRFSLLLPTGDEAKGAGRGVVQYQVNLPLSVEVGPSFVLHVNAGGTVTPGFQTETGDPRTLADFQAGAALVWLLAPEANLLVEAIYSNFDGESEDSERSGAFTLNPGVRFAHDFSWGLQIVPGFSVPITVGEDETAVGLLTYLSFEHPIWEP